MWEYLAARLKEPSTHAILAGIAGTVAMNSTGTVQMIAGVVAGMFATAGVTTPEGKK